MSTRTATVLTHRRVSDTAGALRELMTRQGGCFHVRDGQVESVLESSGEVLTQPVRQAFRKGRHDDLIEFTAAQDRFDRTHGVAVPHLAVSRGAGCRQSLERRLQLRLRKPPRLFTRSRQRQHATHDRHGWHGHGLGSEMLHGGRRHDDPELRRFRGRTLAENLDELVGTQRLIGNDEIATHRTSRRHRRPVVPSPSSSSRRRPRPWTGRP